jgi:hypothetical protein
LVVAIETGCDSAPDHHPVKDLILIAELYIVGVRENVAGRAVKDVDQTLRILDGQRAHQR